MGETDIRLGIEEAVDQGHARNQTSEPERLKDSSPTRAVLPSGIIRSELNPYVLCHVLFQRTRQLAARNPGKPFPQVIKITKAEFREGKLEYLIPQVCPDPSGSADCNEGRPIRDKDKRTKALSWH
jgi:hypothetical protein